VTRSRDGSTDPHLLNDCHFFPKTYHMLRQAARRGVSSEVQGGEIILCDWL